MKNHRVHFLLAGFSVFFVALVVLADTGHGQRFFSLAGKLPAGDKLGHFVLFGFLSFLVNLILRGAMTRLFRRPILKGSAVILALATLEECSQLFFQTRSFDLLDLAADGLGIWLFGRAAFHYLNWKRGRVEALAVARRE